MSIITSGKLLCKIDRPGGSYMLITPLSYLSKHILFSKSYIKIAYTYSKLRHISLDDVTITDFIKV